MSSVIGINIKKFRQKKGLTQKKLGELVGVTTQAISKWEHGGTPDAELLPSIADNLEVSVDALFGREQDSMEEKIAKELCAMDSPASYEHAFTLCWAILLGLTGEDSIIDNFTDGFVNTVKQITAKNFEYYSKLMHDGGIVTARLSTKFRYFFLLPQPEKGIREKLTSPERLSEVFSTFSDIKVLKILFYLYSRLNTPISASLIAKNTELTIEETETYMDKLCRNNLADKSVIATENGEIKSYMFRQESSVIPLLCFADELCRNKIFDFVAQFDRTIPLL